MNKLFVTTLLAWGLSGLAQADDALVQAGVSGQGGLGFFAAD